MPMWRVQPNIAGNLHGTSLHHSLTPCPPRPRTALRSVSAMATAASASFGGAALLGLATLGALLKVRSLEKKEAALTGGGA